MGRKNNKKNSDKDQLVFTTSEEGNPFFNDILLEGSEEEESSSKSDMRIRVTRDRKNRGGKEVTVVMGLELNEDDLEDLAKKLKQRCGVGGAAKDGEILIQGNKVDKVIEILKKDGYKDVKRIGG